MRSWKHYGIVNLIVIIIFTFIACDKDVENNDFCNCNPKAHLGINENCSCGSIGCDCSEQIVMWDNTNIQIRKNAGVTVEQMNSAVEMLNVLFVNALLPDQKVAFQNNISEIRLGITGTVINHNNSIITTTWNVDIDSFGSYLMNNNLLE